MATNNFSLKSVADLEAMAASYGTSVASFLEDTATPEYEIADVSKIDFLNISTFVTNAVIKDGTAIEAAETEDYSVFFSNKLKKYFEEALTVDDIIALKTFVNEFNQDKTDTIYNNLYTYVYGVNIEEDGIDAESIFGRITSTLKTKIKTLVDVYMVDNSTITSDLTEWLTSATTSTYTEMTALEFYDSLFTKSKLIEAIILIRLVYYINNDISTIFSSTEALDFEFDAITATTNNVGTFKKLSYSSRTDAGAIEYFRRTENSIQIKSNDGSILLTLPLNITEAIGDSAFSTFSTEITKEVFSTLETENSLSAIFSTLEDSLYEFLTTLYDSEESNEQDYFGTDTSRLIQTKLNAAYTNTAKLFKNKDLIQDNWFNSTAMVDSKNYANEYETTIAKDGQQLIFIDAKDMIISGLSDLQLNGTDTTDGLLDLFSGIDTTQRLTYTVLYKELNIKLREQCLIDSQEYIISRLITTTPGKEILFATNKSGISFSSSADTYYKNYIELDSLFQISDDFYRYKYFYNNAYITRLSNETDLVGYYVGDSSTLSEFTNNYGDKDYEQREIENFLNIYQETRNYYYKVLLNKSFIQETEYKLYERLFISFFSIERFMNAKIDNIHDPDFFNSTDIYNFLESYGLGVLNDKAYDFILEEKDYKINIIKLFNELVKLKGSRDVISILLQVFEVGDLEAEIKKFLILENTDYTDGTKNTTGTIKFVEVPYFSDNGSREIYSALETATNYEEFLADDPYWDTDAIPESTLLGLGLDVSETKYLSLTLSENIYKKYILSRYMMSTLEYLETNLVNDDDDPVLYNTYLDTGELFNVSTEVSIHSLFEAVKVKYKALLRLYALDETLVNYVDPGSANTYYGINTSIDWTFLTTGLLADYTYGFTGTTLTNFTKAHVADAITGGTETTFDRFNIYKESTDRINFDNRLDTLNLYYREYDYTQKTETARQLEDVIFSTHKTSYGKTDVNNKYQNSGPYMINLFEDLNLLRIDNTDDNLWMYITSKYWNDDYEQPTSTTYDPSGLNLNYKDLYYKAIEGIMKFPVDLFNGLLSPYSDSELYHNEAFQTFTEDIFTNVYQSSEDPIFVDTTTGYTKPADLGTYLDEAIAIANNGTELTDLTDDERTEKIAEYTTDILTLINGLQSLFSSEAYMQWSLSLKGQEEATLQFVQTAVEIFLSYTTELYYTTFKKTYDSYSEIVPFAEKITQQLEAHKIDMVYYDETLNIETLTEGVE